MAFLSWHERFRVGHAEVDAQHQNLFSIVNRFNVPDQTGPSVETARAILEDLLAAVMAHFKFEEELMDSIAYPDLAEHKQMHEDLIKQLWDLLATLKRGGHKSMPSIVRFLADWLVNHIVREDMAYKPHLKG